MNRHHIHADLTSCQVAGIEVPSERGNGLSSWRNRRTKPPKTRAQHFRRFGSPGFSGRLALTLLPQSIAVSLSVDGVSTVCDAQSEFRFGSGPGIRTLNLAVNRSLLPVQK